MMKRLLTVILTSITLTACAPDPDRTERVLTQHGYTNIQTKGYAMFSCSDDDFFRTKFKATSPSGHEVRGAVCSGFFKGSTIRLD